MAHPLKALLGGRAVAHFPTLGKIYGSNPALLLSSLCFWEGKGVDPDWSYKSAEELYDETGLTDNEQITARARLVKSGVISEERRGRPCRLWYKVNWDVLNEHLAAFEQDPKFKAFEDKRRKAKTPSFPNNGELVSQIMGNQFPNNWGTVQSNPELPTSDANAIRTIEEDWDAMESAKDAPVRDDGLIPMLPEEVHLFDALNKERAARHYTPFIRFKTTKQREKFRECVAVFNGSTTRQIDEIIANGKRDIEGVVNALDWRRKHRHSKHIPEDTTGAGVLTPGSASFYG